MEGKVKGLYNQNHSFNDAFKRFFDIVVSLIGLIILSPLLLIIAILIKVDSKGPVFFKQVRVGQYEKEFKILKFRTMVVDAEKLGKQITVGMDRRITKVGYFLRKYKLDEFPQLINVLIGDMSLVGPRPEVPRYTKYYNTEQKAIFNIRPGITDYASIKYSDESELLGKAENPEKTYIEEIMVDKLRYNLEYLRNRSVIEDISIIYKTALKILK
ncbi:sugar transferase [Bacillus sp. REN16]|uniref:sugar transferase n=1 Tax=Bacillus sp. REN16 TaxID=2887296 RepID=UPI001E466D6B|nr:sugar transferase [Bacillus sp. REN16]MCC3356913.1 sugar transferase [Bacillus sp. REN16]